MYFMMLVRNGVEDAKFETPAQVTQNSGVTCALTLTGDVNNTQQFQVHSIELHA
jgi:hypothetical protein